MRYPDIFNELVERQVIICQLGELDRTIQRTVRAMKTKGSPAEEFDDVCVVNVTATLDRLVGRARLLRCEAVLADLVATFGTKP